MSYAEKERDIVKTEAGPDSPVSSEVHRPAQDDVRVTAKTWFVVAILSFGYGLSFIVSHCERPFARSTSN